MPREKLAAGLRCLILTTVFVMARSHSEVHTRAFELVVSFGAAYVLVSTFVPWSRYDLRRAVLVLLSLDIILISALIYSQSGIYSEYYLLYYLPILHASVRLNFRDAVGTCLLSAASYLLIGMLQGAEATVTMTVIHRVATFAMSASLMAAFFVLLAREQRAYQKLNRYYQEAMQAKSEFLSRVSHEFRTPLTAIVGFSQLLYEHEKALDPDRQREYLVIIREQSQHLARMIEDMLDLSRIDEGRLTLKREAVHLPDAVDAALTLLDHPGDRERVKVSLEHRPRTVWADRNEVEQVLARLLHAALTLSGESTPVSVTVGPAGDEAEQVSLEVPDWEVNQEEVTSLLGAPEAKSFQGRSTGRNLGLVAARALIELHGGRIWVEEGPDAGGRICFSLPVYRRKEAGRQLTLGARSRSGLAGAETHGEGADRGRRPVRAQAHAGQPESVG
jgi:two-component system cell cycle sensor histidine kinase PleC